MGILQRYDYLFFFFFPLHFVHSSVPPSPAEPDLERDRIEVEPKLIPLHEASSLDSPPPFPPPLNVDLVVWCQGTYPVKSASSQLFECLLIYHILKSPENVFLFTRYL